jgi:glycosyltransferase involved in cell wall biosynthesis
MIALVMGRGVEGCGVTRYTIEYKNWLEKQGKEVVVYALKDKGNFTRANAQKFDYEIFTADDDISGKLNECEYVVYMSVPSNSNSTKAKNSFIENCVKKVKVKKVFIQHDHKNQSLIRNAKMWVILEMCDIVFTHCLQSDFGILYQKPKLVPSAPIYEFKIGIDFSELAQYRKKFFEKVDRISYFGRFARFKHPERLLELRKGLKANIITEMRGLERSIEAVDIYKRVYEEPYDIIDYQHSIKLAKEKIKDKEKLEEEIKRIQGEKETQNCFDKTYVYGPYSRDIGMEEISKSKFGCSFYELDARAYGNHVEFAMLEIVGLGLIPIFSKHWGDNTKHISGKPFSQVKNSGIYMSPDNIDEVCEKIIELNDNENLYNDYVDRCIEVYKQHSSTDVAFQDLQVKMGETIDE